MINNTGNKKVFQFQKELNVRDRWLCDRTGLRSRQ